jgi:hypothetical protein
MNTPAHLILNAAVLGRGRWQDRVAPISLGAVLPDLPMLGFYLYQRLVERAPEHFIWSEAYFDRGWQAFFDVFNSLPIIGLLAFVAWRAKSTWWLCCFASMALHCLGDLPLHREDAHAHFYPLSSWHFVSPVSYWDPRFYGDVFLAVEGAGMIGALAILWRRTTAWRWVGLFALSVQIVFGLFAAAMWLSLSPDASAESPAVW